VPTFCRHNRFVERCPICSKTLPEHAPAGGRRTLGSRGGPGRSSAGAAARARGARGRSSEHLKIRREARAQDDGYRSSLAPGLRASSDAELLAEEIAFASARLQGLAQDPPGVFADAQELALAGDYERATWICFVAVYLSPLQGGDPFGAIRAVLAQGEAPALEGVALGPRSSHDPTRDGATLRAYHQWVQRAGKATDGSELSAFVGEESWTPQRRFARVFERLALPGFGRMGRYELLVTLGHLGLYELSADSLCLGTDPSAHQDPTTVAAKRIFGIGESIHLQRRSQAFAQAIETPIDVLDLAFANWGGPERATLGFADELSDGNVAERARAALGL
jgi:Alpha-glutamyl/putrescinyl thymine pyrophosphorylase clade 3